MSTLETFLLSRQTFDGIRYLMLGTSMLMLFFESYKYMKSGGTSVNNRPQDNVRKSSAKVSQILNS